MSRKSKLTARIDSGNIEIKSKFNAEFRRFSVDRYKPPAYNDFQCVLEKLHCLNEVPFILTYIDPTDGDLLPINNHDNFVRALSTARPLLRLLIQLKGTNPAEINGYGTVQRRPRPFISKLIPSSISAVSGSGVGDVRLRPSIAIGLPEDFRRVSAIIDVDILPETQRRVRFIKNGLDRPLGFYIRDGTSIRVTSSGLEKVPGVFVSRLVPGGLAEGTGLLAVNDEVLEVNGIEVAGKTLDQVTDMMVANSANLIITVTPINQHNNVSTGRRGAGGSNQSSLDRREFRHNVASREPILVVEEEDLDEDEIQEHLDNNSDVVMTVEAPVNSGLSKASNEHLNNQALTKMSMLSTQVLDEHGEEIVYEESLS